MKTKLEGIGFILGAIAIMVFALALKAGLTIGLVVPLLMFFAGFHLVGKQ